LKNVAKTSPEKNSDIWLQYFANITII